MTYFRKYPAMAITANGTMRQGYTQIGNSWSAFPSFCSLLAFIAPMKNAKDAALPRITAAEICKNPNMSISDMMDECAKKSMKGCNHATL